MNKRHLLFAAGLAAFIGASAAPLSPEQALARVRTSGPAKLQARTPATKTPVYTEVASNGSPAAYVFKTAGAGYMILSADDIAFPVLGYSDSADFDENNISPEFRYWMGEYARQIEWASEHGAKPAGQKVTDDSMAPIKPLCETKWNQDAPFYNQCPKYNGDVTFTGCVATAMAQVMKYHNYPEVGQGTVRYTPTTMPGRNLTLNFEKESFDWDNMIPVYESGNYTEAQAAAVAYLMKACGYGVEMNYGTNASGASAMDISKAFIDYFKYDQNVHSELRIIYSPKQWSKLVYDNLKNVGPVIMNGSSPIAGGHSFVCDGYDGNGYFHFNWGWGGMSDGYYSLDALNPDAQGIGGYAGGFNFQQNIIAGIRPPVEGGESTVQPLMFQYGTSIATISGRNVTFQVKDYTPLGWGNALDRPIKVLIGAECTPINGTSGNAQIIKGTMGSSAVVSLSAGYAYYMADRVQPKVTLPELADGSYRLTLVTRDSENENAPWMEMTTPWGYKNYVIINVKGGVYTVENVDVSQIVVTNLEAASASYAGKNMKLKAHVANNSDMELCQGLSPVLFDAKGNQVFMGESVLLSLDPKESKEFEWVTKFLNANGGNASVSKATEYTMKLYNPQNQRFYEGVETKITLNPAPSSTTLMLTGLSIEDATKSSVDVLGVNFPVLWEPVNLYNFNAIIKVKVTKGFYDGRITCNLFRQNPDIPNATLPVADDIYNVMPFMAQGEEREITVNLKDDSLQKGVVYYFQVVYSSGYRTVTLGRIPFMKSDTGVIVVGDDVFQEAEYFSIEGLKIDNPQPGQIVIMKRGNTINKVIWK